MLRAFGTPHYLPKILALASLFSVIKTEKYGKSNEQSIGESILI